MALMCEYAGDFMRTRIEDAWDIIARVHKRTKTRDNSSKPNDRSAAMLSTVRMEAGMKKLSMDPQSTTDLSRPELYVDAPTRMIWNSLVNLLCAIAKHVTVRAERFEDMLDILDPVLTLVHVREALDHSNADAVWLRLYKKSRQAGIKQHSTSGAVAQTQRMLAKVPIGKPHWHFVQI